MTQTEYEQIDPSLDRLAKDYHLVMFREFDGKPARFFYQSEAGCNTIQVVVGSVAKDAFSVNAYTVEGDIDFSFSWVCSVDDAFLELSRILLEVRRALRN